MTGGTGFIGSHVTAELLKRGHSVFLLARRNAYLSAEERVRQVLDWHCVDRRKRSGLRVLEGRLDDPDLGLGGSRYGDVAKAVDEIINCASNTSFSERKRTEVERANVANLENVLTFAAKSGCSFFHHVSTAYVAGKTRARFKEELADTTEFHNVYEETKYLAERAAVNRCSEEGIRLSVYRPSIIYGDSRSGRTLLFNGLYYPIRTVVFFKKLYEEDIEKHDGIKAKEIGAERRGNGNLYLPLRVEATSPGGINVIPIDYFVQAFTAIMDECSEGGFYHIVNKRITVIEDLARYTERFFGIEGIRIVPHDVFGKTPKNGLEILYDHYVEAYSPYIKDARVFDDARTAAVLIKKNVTCPEFDYDIFSKCMQYALDVDWGTRLFGKP